MTNTATIPSCYSALPAELLVEVTIARGTYCNGPEENYGPGSVILVPPDEAQSLARIGLLGWDLKHFGAVVREGVLVPLNTGPVEVQSGQLSPSDAAAVAAGARVGSNGHS